MHEAEQKPTPYLDGLNPDQFEVAVHLDQPCLVVAGAGSGKTRSVVARVQCLIDWYNINPNDILCITFTRKAAAEMRERIGKALTEEQAKDIQVRTFHSTGVRLCRSFSHLMGLRDRISVWDERAAKRQMKLAVEEILQEKGIEVPLQKARAYTVPMLLELLDKWKQRGEDLTDTFWRLLETEGIVENMKQSHKGGSKTVSDVRDRIANKADKMGLDGGLEDNLAVHLKEMTAAIRRYEQTKRLVGAVDLSDLIWLPVVKSKTNFSLRDALAGRWKYVIVDEYQDTNDLQEMFIETLVCDHNNLMVVGDDDQAIYGWRGSNVELITSFERRWGSRVIRLGQNYRSRPVIVDCAAASIGENQNRVAKHLWSEREPGGSVTTVGHIWQSDEIASVGRKIQAQVEAGVNPKNIAVLARRRTWVSMMHSKLINLKIPTEAVGVKAWYELEDVQLMMAFLRGLANRRDIDAAQQVLASWPCIGAQTIKQWYAAIENGDNVYDRPLRHMLAMPRHGPQTKKGKSILALIELMAETHDTLMKGAGVGQVVKDLLVKAGITKEIQKLREGNINQNAEAEYRSEGIQRLIEATDAVSSVGFDAITDLSDEITTLISAQSTSKEAVTVSTIHSAKGLEWDHVYVIGCSQGIMPSGDNIEEERRLFYVASTRARENLEYSYSTMIRGRDGKMETTNKSTFIDEAMIAVF